MATPTNAEIMRELKRIENNLTGLLEDHHERIVSVERYISDQIAVAKYVAENGTIAQKQSISKPQIDAEGMKPTDLAKTISVIFAFFTGVIALITYIIQLVLKG